MSMFLKQRIRILPRWAIFLVDVCVAIGAFVLAVILNQNFVVEYQNLVLFQSSLFYQKMLCVLFSTCLTFIVFRTHHDIVRFTSSVDAIRIFLATLFNFAFLLLLDWIVNLIFDLPLLSFSFVVVYMLLLLTGLNVYRTLVRAIFKQNKLVPKKIKNVLMYGAGHLGFSVKRGFENDFTAEKNIVAYLDDDPGKTGKSIDGLRIFKGSDIAKVLRKYKIDEVIFATLNLSMDKKDSLVEICLENDVEVLTLPPVERILNGELTLGQVKNIRIEDLLERPPIDISSLDIKYELQGKRVLVTGAAGSIGSEIAKQLGKFDPQLIVLCDQAETPLHNLQLDLQDLYKTQVYHTYMADIKSMNRMRRLFETFRPQYVYHAAAYKHVPMMEANPSEAVKTNVKGTFQLANLAVEFDVSKFVFVSTDKAVNPTNVMGASKRIAEVYVQSLNSKLQKNPEIEKTTKFITTRFGNVLGSNGSVIPRFRQQIENGGPVTVTHPEITRYFMTIPEACQLVIQAGNMGKGGEIFVFDMGKSVKIVHLAEKMIKLSGAKPYKDINIKFTGLRPGEKLYEELLNDLENTIPTPHEKIMIAMVRENDYDQVYHQVQALIKDTERGDDDDLVRKMKEIIPEFISQNSIFSKLDSK